MKQVAKAMLVV